MEKIYNDTPPIFYLKNKNKKEKTTAKEKEANI